MRALALFLLANTATAQVCRLSVAGLNQNRRVTGEIAAECPNQPIHSAPFGNWGATSNFGPKRNGRQFDGWCHDTRICENGGACRNVCRDGWYEWNTCTTHPLFRAPNCTFYNSEECTAQVSVTGVNVLGTQTVDIPVSCPASSDGRTFDRGGCASVREYTRTDNFMSLYELDPVTGDELIQSLYFPALTVETGCNAWGCPAAGSPWADAVRWDSPSFPAKVFAQMAIIVNSGTFVNTGNACRTDPVTARIVSSASLTGPAIALDSLATAFTGGVIAPGENAQIRVTGSSGVTQNAAISFQSPAQFNFLVPAGLGEGTATVAIAAANTVRATGSMELRAVEPGLFTAPGLGTLAAAVGVRRGGSQITFECADANACRALPVDAGTEADPLYLVLFGTGIRNRSALAAVEATVGGLAAVVEYAGPQLTFAGLDQINVRVPPSLSQRGMVVVSLVVDGRPANAVSVLLR